MKKDLVKTVKIISSFLVLSMGLSGCTLPDSSVSEPQVEVHFADEIEPPTLLGQYPVEPQEDEFLDEVPEYISDRGIILRGPLRDPKSPKLITFHTDTKGNGIWIDDYTCDCDLAIAGSDQEFTDFCDRFSAFDDPYYFSHWEFDYQTEYNSCIYSVQYGRDASQTYYGQVFRSCFYGGGVSGGTVYMDGDPGISVEIFYDPSGKYMLLLNNTYIGEVMDDFILTFLEPEMVKLDIIPAGSEYVISVEDPEAIGEFVGAMHDLCVLETEGETPDPDTAEEQLTFSFTDVNGYVNDYTIAGEYLIHGEDVYRVENPEKLGRLTDLFEKLR